MIREILEEYFDSGDLPALDKNEDPFWDPPNPILIGQSFLQLEPLGVQIENQLEAAILSIDGTGGRQGTINLAYKPCNNQGDTDEDSLPPELQVDDVTELIGKKNLYFQVYIESACDLPENLCYNTFVTYQFKFWPEAIYQTAECAGSTRTPQFNYEQMHCIENISKDIA